MASNFLRLPGLGTSPLQGLARYFETAQKQTGIITLPGNTLETIKEYRTHGFEHSEEELDTIVHALEPGDAHLCERIDAKGLVGLCSILIHSQACLAQQRGLYLLTEAIYTPLDHAESQSQSAITLRQPKKVAIGSCAMSSLIKGFAGSENTDQSRRSMGILALELLKACPENVSGLRADYPRLQSIGGVIKHGRCQVLKLLAGSMINIMLNHGVMPGLIWSDKIDLAMRSRFPRAEQQNTQWVISFEGFLEELDINNFLTQERSSVIFAYATLIGDSRYSTAEESAILVTVSKDLSIIIPESGTAPARYIDVPLVGISSVTIEGQANSQSQTVSYALTIQLSTDTECTCFIDASARNHRLIVLAFVSENDAQTLLKLIQAGSSTTARGGRLSISQGVALPQQLSEDEPVTPSTDNDQDLSKTTSGAVSFKAQNPPPVTMQPRSQSQSLTTSNKESVTDPLDFQQAKPSTHEMPSRTSISLGVNVSQTNSTNHDIMCNQLCSKAGDEGYKDPCHPDTAENAQDSLPYVSRIAPNTRSSSLLRQPTEVESLKDVAETHNNPNFPGNQSSAILQGLQHGMEDHGSSHEAVFGTYKDVFRSSTNEVLPPGSSPIPGHGLHISAQANLETIVTNDEAPSKLHAVSLNRTLQATQVKNASKFNTAHQPSRNTSPEKLKWSFRGGGESKREVSAENEPKQSEDISPQLMKKAERGRKEKPIELTKTKVRTQKELRSIKKPLAPGIRSGPAATQLSDGVDEYEVQDSPSNLNRSRPAARAKQRKTNGTGAEAITKSQRDPNFVSTAKITRRKSTKGIDQDKELLSKERHRLDDQSSQAQTNEPVKPVRNRQTDKQRQTLKKPKAVAQPTLAATIRPRPRREAARKANARIQGLEIGSKSTSIDEQRAKAREQSIIETSNAGTDINGLSIGSNDRAAKGKSVALAAVAKLGARKPGILKAHTKSSSSPRKPEPSNDSISKSSLGIDNSDQVDLIGGQDSENANDSHEGAQSSDVKAADPPEVQNRGPEMLEDEFIVKKSTLSAKEQDSALNQMAGAADHIHLPDIVPKIKDVIDETETNITARPIMDSLGRPLQQIMVGDAEDSYFQAAINDMEGGSKQLGRQRVAMSNFDIDTHGEDPFGTRLGLLLPASRVANDRLGYIEPQNTRSVPETQDFLNAKVQKNLNSLPTVTKTKISNAQTPDNLAAPAVNDSRLAQDESRATRLSQPSSSGKRRLEESESELKKRLKLTPLRENGAITERQGLHENSSAKTPVPVISKKPGLISWNSSGPRNQGATSAKKPKPHQTVKAVAPIVQTSGERHELKRKTIDDQGPRQRDQPAKRQRRDFVTPRQSRMYVPQMIAEPDSSAKQDKGHRLSSQSMKVDENGSPLPLAQPRIDHHEPEEKLDDDLLASNDNEIVSNNDDGDNYDVHTPRLPSKQDTVQRTEENLKPMKMIRNSKQQPSSPRAPSAIGTDEPHTILNSGEMVNNETLESILPTLPQDPFVGGPEKPPGSFVKLLRKSSGVEARRESDQANLANSSRGVKRRSIDSDDDPDKTLVEPEREPKRKRQKGNSHSATESSPMTRSTSKDESVVGEQSDNENSYEVRRWLKTLEPHQANMLDILTIITHRLVRHLVDKEMAAKDIINDYEIGGKNLLKGYEEERQKVLETDQAGLDQVKTALSKVYLEAQVNIRNTSKESTKRRTRGLETLEARRSEQEKSRSKAISTAFAACVD